MKNLPPYLTQDAFTKHFSVHAAPTDSRLQSSKSGKSRRFGFVGFSSESEAEGAVQHWNNTYIGSTKISAELARTVQEEATSNYKRKRPAEDALTTAQTAKDQKKHKPVHVDSDSSDPKFQEFLRLNERRSKAKLFLNDDEEFVQQAAVEDTVESESAAEDEYEDIPRNVTEEYEVIEHEDPMDVAQTQVAPAVEPTRIAAPVADDADDAEWLRNRTSRTLDLTDNMHEPIPVPQKMPEPVIEVERVATVKKAKIAVPTAPIKTEEELEAERLAEKEATRLAAVATIKDTSRLFLRNLAFTVDQDALQTLFSNYGPLQEIHIPETKTGTPKGTAYVHFESANDAIAAFSDLDAKSFHGRLLHVLPGQSKITVEKPVVAGAKVNVGEKRKEERRKEAAKSRFNWNSLFLNQNAVMENTAKKFGVSKSELLDPTQSNAAVTMALAESSALNTIKKFFTSHGVNLQSFSQSKQKDDSILLFKNLPSHANEEELRKLVESAGGVIRRIIMPEIGGLAIVEVTDVNQGKMVFGKLAYRKFGDGLIYLEKGPVNTFNSAAAVIDSTTPTRERTTQEEEQEEEEEESDAERATIFVKNLNFESRSPDLTKIFESFKGFRQATVKTKPNPKDSTTRLSMGFGFIEFASEKDARLAMTAMQGFTLSAHALQLKLSDGHAATKPSTTTTLKQNEKSGGTKVIVKNLPFETTKSDIQKLFGTYGSLKSLRLPKKYNSHLRGFAFLEFVSKREAKNAMTALTGTHLLGRRLVLEYAESELLGDEGIDQLINKTKQQRLAVETVEGGKRKQGKVNLDATEDF